MKELKIEIPEGHEIDREKSTFEKIIFKKVGKPMSWGELKKIGGYYIDGGSEVSQHMPQGTRWGDRNVFPTKQDAESALALAQLLQLRKAWIGEWEAIWDGGRFMYVITRCKKYLDIDCLSSSYGELSFPTEKMALDFLEAFKDLIRVYYKL